MGNIFKVWSSRTAIANANTYIGEAGKLFYDSSDSILRLSDGLTPGGIVVSSPYQQPQQSRQIPTLPYYDNNTGFLSSNGTDIYWTTLDAGQF
jgi:hypothetical protein